MQAARVDVAAGFEFSAGVERRHDNFKRRLFVFLMLIHRNAASVIGDADAAARLIEFDRDHRGIPVDDLVDGVIQNFPHQMMQAGPVRPPDIHRRSPPNRINPFQNQNLTRVVFRGHVRPFVL